MPDDLDNTCDNCGRPCAMYLCNRCSGAASVARDNFYEDVPAARRSPQSTRPAPDGHPIHHGSPTPRRR